MKHSDHLRVMLIFQLALAAATVQPAVSQSLQVKGTVTTAGMAVANAEVTFISVTDRTRRYTTLTDATGAYHLDTAAGITGGEAAPAAFRLEQNYPNPFAGATVFSWSLAAPAEALITVYDLLGREVRRFELGVQEAGVHQVLWDGLDMLGDKIAPGAYFLRLQSGHQVQLRKMICFPGGGGGQPLDAPALLPAGSAGLGKESGASLYHVRIVNTAATAPQITSTLFQDVTIVAGAVKDFTVERLPGSYPALLQPGSTRQLIRGFGAANIVGWRPDMTAEQINTAFGTGEGQLGFSILRLRVPSDSLSFRQQVATAKAAWRRGVTLIAAPWSPPAWMKTSHNLVGGKLRTDCYAAFARYLDSFVQYMAQNGAPLHAISVQNEPDVTVTYESCDYNGDDMLRFMRENAPAIGTLVMAPEGCNFNRGLSDPILNDSLATAHLGMVCGHLYGGGLGFYPLAQEKGKEVWMTEHLALDTTWVNVLATGKEIHDCMIANMNAYVWWYIVRYYGPIHENGWVTKRGYVMSQFARFIRPGYRRIEITENPQPGIWLSAYSDGAKIVIVAINTGSKALEQAISLAGGGIVGFSTYVTTEEKSCAAGAPIAVNGSEFTMVLEASSITTLVSQ